MLCEVLSNIIFAEEFAARFDSFSIGSNDLTQLVLGVDRDSEIQVFRHLKNPFTTCRGNTLELLDFACVKINEARPRRLILIMCRPQSINVSLIGIHPSTATRLSDVAAAAAAGRPRLMISLTKVLQSGPHPFCERGQAIAVPLPHRVTGERLTSAVALICEHSDLVHKVRMLRPARRDDIGNIPDVLVVQPGDDSLQPGPDFSSQLKCLAGCGIPGPLQVRQIVERQKVILLPARCKIKLSIGQLHQSARLREGLEERH
jgi:PEP-utilising enzyme, PEP-binding domain